MWVWGWEVDRYPRCKYVGSVYLRRGGVRVYYVVCGVPKRVARI